MHTIHKLSIAFIFLIITIFSGHAQSRKITFSAQNMPIKEALAQIQQRSGYRILYNDEVVPDGMRVSLNAVNMSVKELLNAMLDKTGLVHVCIPTS